MNHLPNYLEFSLQESSGFKAEVGNVTLEKIDKGWLFSTPSKAGRGKQIIAFTDSQVDELIKILQEKK